MNKKALGYKLKKYRLKAELTQAQLADEIGKGKNYISDIERGVKKPSLDVFISLAKTLNASADYLLKESLNTNISEPEKQHYYTDKQAEAMKKIHEIYIENFDT